MRIEGSLEDRGRVPYARSKLRQKCGGLNDVHTARKGSD